ncbi:thiazole-phosphate synthase [Rhodoblastus acidophilus]|uniref:Thiazole synthase n=1 Tax=Rhodoblastus acidophilus TaxID=1074 RepID=A0A212RIC4_RHOAC|nr:thiazole synthase [Rhodoblastus acidophilus]PPQ38060.1 thiazole synthase [Rhodoblastus acidophilus]RAI18425.1 thiazole synthase [Rhodoblastus acidophilus]SNB72034.1 thiazole-phosphate synthase [Rhodoblastus acidophilus]
MNDPLNFYGVTLQSRLLVGTSQYPSPAILADALAASKTEVVTVSLRREAGGSRAGEGFWGLIRETGLRVLPNTAGCRTVKEAVTTAHMARELFATKWIKLEVIGDDDLLAPDPFGLVEAARILCDEGFEVFPYMTEDLLLADRLVEAGCRVLMPWAAPIGSGRGLNNVFGLRALRARYPDIPLVIDAGLGAPSQASQAFELGFDAVLLNTAIAKAGDPVAMARAFALACEAGRTAYKALTIEPRDMAEPSTPVLGRAFT